MYDLSGLGLRIRQLRMQKGFTQDSFAKELGVSAQAVSKWETGAGCPDIAMLPLIANILETSIDSLFTDADPEPAAAIREEKPAEPVPGELVPVYTEEPEPEQPGELRVVFASANLECLSDMTPESIDGLTVRFPDGSSADLKTRTIVNYGNFTIKIREAERRNVQEKVEFPSSLGDEIFREVDDVLKNSGIYAMGDLGEALTERINRAVDKGRVYVVPEEESKKPGELSWNGADIDSLDISVSGSVNVNVHEGTPGKWSIVARGRREFLNSLRCIEDGNLLKIETLPYQSTRSWLLGGAKNTIDICTGFAQGVDLDAKIKGSGNLICEPAFQSSSVSVSGSGDVELGDAGNLTSKISGSGDITFVSARNANVTVSGSGDIHAGRIEGISEVKISGSGDADLSIVTGELTCNVSGSGDINIGEMDLEDLSVRISGSGDAAVAAGKTDRLEVKLGGSSDFDAPCITVGELVAELNGPSDAVIGRLLGKSVERISRMSTLRILQRG